MSRIIVLGAAALLVAGGLAAWAFWPSGPRQAPDPAAMETEQLARYIAGDAFGKLPVDQRVAFMERAREATEAEGGSPMRRFFAGMGSLTEEELDRARRNMREVGRAMMDKRLRAYGEADAEEKTRMLDEMIDRMRERTDRRSERPVDDRGAERSAADEGEGRPRGGDRDGRRPGPTPERMKRHLETADPETRAMRMQFMEDLRDRMEERGIEPRWGRGRR